VPAPRRAARRRLQRVARCPRSGLLDHAPTGDRILDRGDDQPLAELVQPPVAELERLGEVVARVDVHHGERERCRTERLLGEPEQDDRILAAAEQQHGTLELRCDLAHHLHRLGLERSQVR